MKRTMQRRRFLATSVSTAAVLGLGPRYSWAAAQEGKGAPNAEKLGWHLGCQMYSFRLFPFDEALKKVVSLGLKYIEAYPGQVLSESRSDVHFNVDLSADDRKEVKKMLDDAGVKLAVFGVYGLGGNVDANRRAFDFAKDMGIETITSEPPIEALEGIDELCQEYGINVALHNHPEPSRYWNPDTVLEASEGRSKRIGACADTGHWMRSGIRPLDAVRKLEGRIISFHFKDLNEYGRSAHDVPWGTGKGEVKAVLEEIHKQGFRGVFSIEYEHNWENSLPEIAESVAYFDQVAAELASG